MAKINSNKPCGMVYALSEHPFLGFLFEPYIVQLNPNGEYSLSYQKLHVATYKDFIQFIGPHDIELIQLLDQCTLENLTKKYHKGNIQPKTFFESKLTEQVLQLIKDFVAKITATAIPLLEKRKVFLKAKDGYPAQTKLTFADEPATVIFHFIRGEQSMRYYPTIKFKGQKIEFIARNAKIVSEHPACLLLQNVLYKFEGEVDGKKLKTFLDKRYVEVPRSSEETYFKKFVTPLIEQYHVHAEGFKIISERYEAVPKLKLENIWNGEIQVMLYFQYGDYVFPYKAGKKVSVSMQKEEDSYVFHRVRRSMDWEKSKAAHLMELGLKNNDGAGFSLDIYHERNLPEGFDLHTEAVKTQNKYHLLEWLTDNSVTLSDKGFLIDQSESESKYLIANSTLDIRINENKDWFDVEAIVKFGEFEIPFKSLRKNILHGLREYKLPNGQIAIIPEQWFAQLKDLFNLSDEGDDEIRLKKHHFGLVRQLKEGNFAEVSINRKLEKLLDFDGIEDNELPAGFSGSLRPYQKAGYNWMNFLNQYNFGGCLADDMGLGKTVQTLCFIQQQKEHIAANPIPEAEKAYQLLQPQTSLIVMPTSLIYNWKNEAARFTPDLKLLIYTGTDRDKRIENFANYDLIITSYGTARIDSELISEFYFNYIILDESQTIKNYSSQIAKTVLGFKSRNKLILSGTPIENSVRELWTQMHFVNEGLLGNYNRFTDEFVIPIEKDQDENRLKKLHAIIKPFILRRTKEQVAKDLPAKIEQVVYCDMTESQLSYYEKIKSEYRNEILKNIDENGMGKSAISILTGLTKLRQISNHPAMVDDNYEGDSGKFEEVQRMIESAISENHKILIFSQFVKQLQIFKKHLEEQHVKFAYLDGSTPPEKRKDMVDEFQNDTNLKVFLISLKAGGVGLNLTAADYVFILDPWWNPAIEQQAVDRSHRIGQTKTVFTYKFIAKESVEEKIVKLQEHKKKLSQSLITTEDSFIKSLSKEDIQMIFN